MSVRVNLLPGDVAARGQASRTRVLAAVAFGVLVLALAGIALVQRAQLRDAQDRLVAAEAVNAQLQADISALQPFADLEVRATSAAATVSEAMGNEISFAGIFQDLSAAMPPGAEFDTLSIVASNDPLAPSAGGERLVWGSLTGAGRAVGLVPGVERLLIDLGRVAAFENVYVPTSVTGADGVTAFTLEVDLGPEVRTERYAMDEEQG